MTHVPFRAGAKSSPTGAVPERQARTASGATLFRGTALITGASSGIGAAVALRLASEGGWRMVLNGRNPSRLSQVATRACAAAFPADLTGTRAGPELAGFTLERLGRLDLLVACAGVGWAGEFTHMPLSAIEEVVAVDLLATLHVVRHLAPHMAAAGTGRIVLIGSVAGSTGVRGEAVYSAVKAGLGAFADALRYELRPAGVAVSHVIPGVVDTPFFERRGVPYLRSSPRPVAPERVADAVWDVVRHGKDEVFVPAWLRLPAMVRGVAPGLYRRLATVFG
ncbi:SDR family NAD(P)-dependent oxidoreductase [Streptomyces spinosus]|uniref:SDR family NAD(P)-dependent oxidoreductase n=1 Tax=Streptomyces spinosus TaxID=2872623 RepID=UPI001CEDE80A|nr:SDR family NAD(P)-dependent oxidoreductase [Streptomyces spinosus]